MQPTPADAQLVQLLGNQLAPLAELYDRFAHALDPFDQDRDMAEQRFETTISSWFDEVNRLEPNKPLEGRLDYQGFRRAIIRLCKQYLKANQPRIDVRGKPSKSN